MSRRRELLVISYHYPPDGAIGGMRWAGLTRHLAPLGWHSRVITAAPIEPNGPSGVTAIAEPRRATLNDLYKRWRQTRSNGTGAGNGDAVSSAASAWLGRLRFEAGMMLALPDDARGWILRAAWRARREIARRRPDVIVSSGPPHSAHLVAWLATRGSAIPWIADLRDPWAGPMTDAWRSSARFRSGVARWLIPQLERLVLQAADRVLCNTREFAAALRALHPDARIDWLPNGVDRDTLPGGPSAEPAFAGLGIAHVGTLYGGRNLDPVLSALRSFLDAHPAARADGTRLRLAGHVDAAYRHVLPGAITRRGLDRYVDQLGVLPRTEALRLAQRSRLALVLAQGQDLQVPAKLYELVALGLPTLVIAGPGSAADSEARRIGALTAEPDDIAGIAQTMGDRWSRAPAATTRRAERLDYADLAPEVDVVCREML